MSKYQYYLYNPEKDELKTVDVGRPQVIEKVPDLNGEWIGYYPGHYDEVVRIVDDRTTAEAIKITGDDNVPAGETTWRAHLRTGIGEGQVAEAGYRNPLFVPGRLHIVNKDRIIFHWENFGAVEFRRDD
jgi:hypothetical protein